LYKVVPDQLRISQGWVKCGQCGEIFDAAQHLIEAFTEPEEPLAGPSADPADVSLDDANGSGLLQQVDTDQTAEQQRYEFSEPESQAILAQDMDQNATASSGAQPPAPAAQVDHEVDAALPVDSEPSFLSSTAPDSDDLIPDTEPELLSNAEDSVPLDADPQMATSTPSFMRHANHRFVWFGHWTNRVLWTACAVLVVGLGCQWIYQDHDRLAASRPQWRPALDSICNVLQCSIAPLQQIESIAIDSAAFSKGEPGRYRLSFTLKNTANLMLAIPNIELTLTDVQDRVVVRRVISPPEFLATADYLTANADWPVMVNLRIQTEASSPAIVGYRLLAFYP
jgi:predicted Zn finger-like uncharacterized protein